MDFSNQNILITGSADGLGFAISRAFSNLFCCRDRGRQQQQEKAEFPESPELLGSQTAARQKQIQRCESTEAIKDERDDVKSLQGEAQQPHGTSQSCMYSAATTTTRQ